jgi:phospholipid-binding lipoprotein MlaA
VRLNVGRGFTLANVISFAAALMLSGCASMPGNVAQRTQMLQASAVDTSDPLEPMNRAFLQGNLLLYQGIERPLGGAYKTFVPQVARDRVSAALDNLQEPRIFVNDVLQGRGQAATTTFGRFLLNSTFGIGGLFDWATGSGLPRQSGDFGQTLYVWGFDSGPYLVLPILGPSNIRDGIGKGVDPELNANLWVIWRYGGPWPSVGIAGFMALSEAGGLDDVLAGSLDLYPRLRSLYLQKRASELGDAYGITVYPPLETFPDTRAAKPAPAKRHTAKSKQVQADQNK